MNDKPKIKRTYGGSNVTLTFKGSNPTIKEDVLNMLCDSFEERVVSGSETEKVEHSKMENKIVEPKPETEGNKLSALPVAPKPAPHVQKRRRPRAR
ncbi:MAG: hypothetical protein IJR91_02345 [Ruminococcus sp.]|nr:hypothetical protein [Ruminococcus sp.]